MARPGEGEPHELPLTNPGSAVYGLITVGVLLAAEAPRRETYARTVGAVVVALVLYWLAHAYAGLLGRRLQEGEALSLGRLLATMRHELPLLGGAALPLLVLLLCWAFGASLSNGMLASLWSSAVAIALVELAAGLRAERSGAALAVETLAGALLGALVIVLRIVLH